MRFLRRTISAMRPWEKWLLLVFSLLLVASFAALLRQFHLENTERIPVRGGTYIEGSVGTIRMLNQWFTITNDVNRDITSLVFSGLQRYNPFTGTIEDDIAALTISGNNRIYTLILRDDLFWHDSTEDAPRPVTADDVVFTYRMIKQQGFPNPILQKNFRGVEVEKIDDRTAQFRLEKPYHFFRSNLTLGILPKHLLEGIPPDRLLDALDFNLSPVGSGPYRFKSIVETDLSTEVTLEYFPQYTGAKPFIERVVFRAFPDYPSLLSDLRNLDGVRHVPRNPEGKAIIPKRFLTFHYSLPQYVALFFNMDRELLKDGNLRLGLQLATDKLAIIGAVNEQIIVDTPLLEFAPDDWQYRFQPDAAEGALYDSDWHLPEKARLQRLQENLAKNSTGALRFPQSVVFLETGALLTVTGSAVPGIAFPYHINGIGAVETSTGTWMATIPTDGSTGSVLIGENRMQLGNSTAVIDTFILTRSADRKSFARLREEQRLLQTYEERIIAIQDLRVEDDILRMRKNDEPYGIRVNDRGETLRLRLLTSPLPPAYPKVAEHVAEQWRTIGVDVTVEVPKEKGAFEDRVIRRDYDVLLFGQPLLDNLDSYPYWHSSQIQLPEGDASEGTSNAVRSGLQSADGAAGAGKRGLRLDANNLSQFTDFKADALLEQARETRNPDERKRALDLLREVFRENIPAIVLYSPTYVFAVSEDILGIDLGRPSLHSDRFLGIHRWFVKEGRKFKAGKNWLGFIPWVFSLAR